MRHNKLNKRFGRTRSERKELMRSLARNTIYFSKIKTTLAKAKEASKLVNKLITLAKEGTLQSTREAFRILQDRTLVFRLFKEIGPLFKDRKGGYTRVIRLGNRLGDGVQMAVLELVEKVKEKAKPEKKKKPAEVKEKIKTEEKKPKEEKPKKIEKPKEAPPEVPKAVERPKKEAPKEKEPEPKKEGLFGKIKGLFKKKKP